MLLITSLKLSQIWIALKTGLGYIYRAWCEGLPWIKIETDENRKIYGGLLFHMVGCDVSHMGRCYTNTL